MASYHLRTLAKTVHDVCLFNCEFVKEISFCFLSPHFHNINEFTNKFVLGRTSCLMSVSEHISTLFVFSFGENGFRKTGMQPHGAYLSNKRKDVQKLSNDFYSAATPTPIVLSL